MRHQHESDTQKLQQEMHQLRQQQFTLGTFALVGSGVLAWFAPGITALTRDSIPLLVLGTATLTWLVLLAFLYAWSLDIILIVHVIAHYMRLRGYSLWEVDYSRFYEECKTRNINLSQTRHVTYAFRFYGIIVCAGAIMIARYTRNPAGGKTFMTVLLLGMLGIYLVCIDALKNKSLTKRSGAIAHLENFVGGSTPVPPPKYPPGLEAPGSGAPGSPVSS